MGTLSRVEGERVRVIQHLKRLRTIVDTVLADLERNAPISGPDVAQSVAHTGIDVARSLTALWSFDLAERDSSRCGNVLKGDGGEEYVCTLDPAHTISESDHTDALGLAQWPVMEPEPAPECTCPVTRVPLTRQPVPEDLVPDPDCPKHGRATSESNATGDDSEPSHQK